MKDNKMSEFKEVAKYYLGTGVEVEWISKVDGSNIKSVLTPEIYLLLSERHTPILRPMFKTVEEITIEGYNDGKPFVPTELIPNGYLIANAITGGNYGIVDFKSLTQLIEWHFNVFNIKDFIQC